MSDRIAPVSALGGAVAEGGLFCKVAEVSGQGMITLRGDFSSSAFRHAVAQAAQVEVPEVRRINRTDSHGAAWMSPDELLIFCPRAEAPEAVRSLREALAHEHHLALDVSDARAVFRLTGDSAREALAKGAPVDLARSAFGPGDFRRTRLGQVAVAFGQVGEGPDVFELVCFRSVAGFMFDWLRTAAMEGSAPGVL